MRVEELDRRQWSSYLGSLATDSVLVAVHLADERSSCERETWRALRAISYEPEQDVLMLAVGGDAPNQPALRFFVRAPQRITLAREDTATAIAVVDASGIETVIRFAAAGRQAVAI